jgi:hypothetical protein
MITRRRLLETPGKGAMLAGLGLAFPRVFTIEAEAQPVLSPSTMLPEGTRTEAPGAALPPRGGGHGDILQRRAASASSSRATVHATSSSTSARSNAPTRVEVRCRTVRRRAVPPGDQLPPKLPAKVGGGMIPSWDVIALIRQLPIFSRRRRSGTRPCRQQSRSRRRRSSGASCRRTCPTPSNTSLIEN